ncbi:uncharacterized protein N7459_006167 [Penicillium hispanicum]|uniref:uncharacterized protein n=1 Tax=Penicillium hispanicum TaxID=1080232 RepID=UPI00254132FA|nr:uncharacterized protein N7459_006167 [Penicillium hispanicum]KAJ5580182.1 hypothetical protein N7459_006167 [Penicillium hispanicum]
MRLHLIISRHGLPVTRILWTTTSANSVLGEYGTQSAVPASAIASSRNPNIAFANGGYTFAQLLEDVNEVVPLETEPSVFDPEFSGQWGLEDYVVEVGGSECLHFMEVEGLLRDGDEVVIRALQLADLRARRLCGRHQIAADGKHLIDGVPFGLPFFQRTTSNRPAVTIPPRKKRRTVFSGWDHDPGFGYADPNTDEEGDGEWVPPSNSGVGKELSILPAEHEVSDMGTVIRHPVDYSAETDSEGDGSELEEDAEEELETELKALKEDFEEPASQFIDIRNQAQASSGPSLRSGSVAKRPSSADTLRRGSLLASSLSSKRSRGDDYSPRTSKAVRFNKGEQNEQPEVLEQPAEESAAKTSEPESESESESDSETDSSDSPSSNDSIEVSSSEEEEDEEDEEDEDEDSSSDEDDSSDSSSDSGDSSSEESLSESGDEEVPPPSKKAQQPHIMNPPGQGSIRTKKSNHRYKLRRRLSKLKEIGVLPADADFAALHAWQEENGGWHFPDESSIMSTTMSKAEKKELEQQDFEAKRQKLLRDLASGGIDVDETSEKENVPPRRSAPAEPTVHEESVDANKPETERASRRTLDVASSRRLLFGSLGMRTPKTKEDEEAARRKFAAQVSAVNPRRKTAESQAVEEDQSDADVDWESKLDIRATECRWDEDAHAIIGQRKGWGKKRKRKQRIQVYNGDEVEDEYEDGNGNLGHVDYEGNMELNYDDEEPAANNASTAEAAKEGMGTPDDLPTLPSDPSTIADLMEHKAKPGAIIAFRQLDMSKATNWQPRISEYRVAEVHDVLDNGMLNVRLAVRDRKPKAEPVELEDEEPRQYSGFEMPGMDDEEGEDDGYRELEFAELCDPKLLQPAPTVAGNDAEDKDNAQEGSIASVVEDSMQNAQLAPPPADMDLDETTLITLVTAASQPQSLQGSPARVPDVPSIQTPGGVLLPHTQGQDADDEHSDTPILLSPSFSGFHSARSSPGARIGSHLHGEVEESNLDGHTLIGEAQSVLADASNQDLSALSFLSANQSFSIDRSQSDEQDRQVVEESQLVPNGANNSGPDSLHSIVRNVASRNSANASPARSAIEESPNVRKEGSPQHTRTWDDILRMLRSGQPSQENTDQDKDEQDEPDYELNDDDDRLIHSEGSLHLSLDSSRPPSSSRSSHKPPTSAQQEVQTPKSNVTAVNNPESLPASTRSKHSLRNSASQPNPSQTSVIIDLTSSPAPASQPTPNPRNDELGWVSKPEGDNDTISQSSKPQTRTSTGKTQRMAEVSISPQTSQKKSKKRLSRKF